MAKGIRDLVTAMQELQDEFELSGVSAEKRMPDGHTITTRLSDELLSLEREDGHYVLLNAATLS